MKRKEVASRLKVIEFHDKYGTPATVSAFGVSRATIYLWKKKFRESGGKLESLISKPRIPKRVKKKTWRPEVIDFILREEGIEHYFSYPRNPKGNGYVERFNRTLEEDFVDFMEEELRNDLEGFNRKLMEYLIWYNGERPHYGLKNKTPIRWYCEDFLKNNPQSKIILTYTIH